MIQDMASSYPRLHVYTNSDPKYTIALGARIPLVDWSRSCDLNACSSAPTRVCTMGTHAVRHDASRVDGNTTGLDSRHLGRLPVDALPLETAGWGLDIRVAIDTVGLLGVALCVRFGLGTEVPGADIRLVSLSRAEARLDKVLMGAEHRSQLIERDVVEENTLAELPVGHSKALLAVVSFPESGVRSGRTYHHIRLT